MTQTNEERACATRVYAFHCGGDRSGMGVYDPLDEDGGRVVYGPYFFFLVEHPDGRVLFDTGAHPKWKGSDAEGGGIAVVVGEDDDVVSRLSTLEVRPEEIEHVVVSHLHFDHAGGLQFFPHATVYVQETELRFAYWPAVYQRGLYDRDDFDHELKVVRASRGLRRLRRRFGTDHRHARTHPRPPVAMRGAPERANRVRSRRQLPGDEDAPAPSPRDRVEPRCHGVKLGCARGPRALPRRSAGLHS